MVRHLQNNIAGFAGNFTRISVVQSFVTQKISITTAAPANELIEQARSISRFVFSRVFGRIN